MKIIKGYKAYNKGLICRDFQFKEGEIFEEKVNPIACQKGFHYCENPMDVLDYYDLVSSEFTEVEALGKTHTDDNKKWSTNKIKIGVKLDLPAFIKASIDFVWEKIKLEDSSNDKAQAASGDNSKLAASGNYSKLAASGNYSKLAASGYNSQLAASGYNSQLAASGDNSQLAASGNYSKLAASGDNSQLELTGKNSVGAAIGCGNSIKAELYCWITLAEYDESGIVLFVKSAKIDGKKLLPNTWYILKDKKFTVKSN
jgi:hypothetical protein